MLARLVTGLFRIVTTAAAGFSASQSLMTASKRLPKRQRDLLERTNHRCETVSLVSGPVLTAAATGAAVLGAGSTRLACAASIAGLGAGAVGLYDDIVGAQPGQRQDKGFRGHLNALTEGRISAGMVKVAGIGLAGLLAGALLYRKPVDALLAGGVIAGTANLINLLDLRPGRAIKAGLALGTPLLATKAHGVAAATMGAAAALLPEDLAEQTMLGDAGANAMGALLGVSIATSTGRVGKLVALAALVGLTAASEKISFTKVIERTPVLHSIDMWGRRPAASASVG